MMARPLNPHLKEICIKYQTGQYGLNELARMYKINKGYLSNYFKQNGITINKQAKEAVEHLTYGYTKFHEVLTSEPLTKHSEQGMDIQVIKAHEQSEALANEIIELVKKANPDFARGIQSLSALMLKRSKEVLLKDSVTSSDIANISKAVSNINDTLGVFPKMPTIAQQFNIGKSSPNAKGADKPIDLKIEFVDTKKE